MGGICVAAGHSPLTMSFPNSRPVLHYYLQWRSRNLSQAGTKPAQQRYGDQGKAPYSLADRIAYFRRAREPGAAPQSLIEHDPS